jgi:hypothetical protein
MIMRRAVAAAFLGSVLPSCGGTPFGAAPADAGASDGGVSDARASDAGKSSQRPVEVDAATADGGPDASTGPVYEVHLRAVQTPVSFKDGYEGDTPADQRVGIRRLTLLRDENDAAPVVVFDHGPQAVDCGLNDGDDTVAGSALIGSLPGDTFTIARVEVGYVGLTVAAVAHESATLSMRGDVKAFLGMTSGTVVDGGVEDQGDGTLAFLWHDAGVFTAPAGAFPVTAAAGAAGGVAVTGGEVDYVFPVNLTLQPRLGASVKMIMTVNTYEDFRWKDLNGPGFASGVFDVSPTTTDQVESFGPNSFAIVAE